MRRVGAPGAHVPSPQELRALRTASGMSQADVAHVLCMGVGVYSHCEQGCARLHPGLWKLMQILVKGAKR
jgi:DNA-binding transcriptional regulator YiaG